MPLKGQAKTDYMRKYMRRRRSGQPKPPPPRARIRCLFCAEAPASDRIMIGDGVSHICESCIAEAVKTVAAERDRRREPGV
jgi:hypothetical protein